MSVCDEKRYWNCAVAPDEPSYYKVVYKACCHSMRPSWILSQRSDLLLERVPVVVAAVAAPVAVLASVVADRFSGARSAAVGGEPLRSTKGVATRPGAR
jgi:hypothetical protein